MRSPRRRVVWMALGVVVPLRGRRGLHWRYFVRFVVRGVVGAQLRGELLVSLVLGELWPTRARQIHGSDAHFWLVAQQSAREEVVRYQEMLLQCEFFVED